MWGTRCIITFALYLLRVCQSARRRRPEPDAYSMESVRFRRKIHGSVTLRPSGVQRLTTQPDKLFEVWRYGAPCTTRSPVRRAKRDESLDSCGAKPPPEKDARRINDSNMLVPSAARRRMSWSVQGVILRRARRSAHRVQDCPSSRRLPESRRIPEGDRSAAQRNHLDTAGRHASPRCAADADAASTAGLSAF